MPKVIDSFRGPTRWLSNFGEVPNLMAFATKIPTVEHGYQAAKCEDPYARLAILRADTPRKARELGQLVILRDDWDEVRDQVMYTLLRRKFANADLQEDLLGTHDAILIEGNTWGDRYWGCMAPSPRDRMASGEARPHGRENHRPWCQPGQCWIGKNRLGELLMQVRHELRLLRGL